MWIEFLTQLFQASFFVDFLAKLFAALGVHQ